MNITDLRKEKEQVEKEIYRIRELDCLNRVYHDEILNIKLDFLNKGIKACENLIREEIEFLKEIEPNTEGATSYLICQKIKQLKELLGENNGIN